MTEQQQQQQIIKQEITSPSIYFENEYFEDDDDNNNNDDYCTYCIESSDHSSHQHQQHHQHQQPVQKDFMPTFYNPFETKHRRRTSRAQFKILETSFYENAKPNATMRRWLAHKLGMTPRSVQVWFQNRRAKAKSQLKKHVNAATMAAAQAAQVSSSSPSSSSLSSSPHSFMLQQQQPSSIPDHESSFYSPMMMNMESPIDHYNNNMDYPSHHLITPNIPMNDDDYYTLTPPMLSNSPSCSSLSPSTMYDHHHQQQQWQYHPSSSTTSSPHLMDDPLSVMSSYYNHPYPSPTDLSSSPITDIIYTPPINMNHHHSNNNILRRTSFPMESNSSPLDKDALRRLSEPIFNLQSSSSPNYLLMDQSLPTSNIIVDDNNICFM